MRKDELEAIVIRAIVDYFANRIVERLRAGIAAHQKGASSPALTKQEFRGRVFSREHAVGCNERQELHVAHYTLVTPLASDELAKRQVRVVRLHV